MEGTEYKTFQSRLGDISDEVKKNAFKGKQVKIPITPEQIDWAEKTYSLNTSKDFEAYRELEANLTVNALRRAFTHSVDKDEKGNPVPSLKTFGEKMSYNEGFYHGLLAMKSERDRIWGMFVKYKQEKGGVK